MHFSDDQERDTESDLIETDTVRRWGMWIMKNSKIKSRVSVEFLCLRSIICYYNHSFLVCFIESESGGGGTQ